MKNFNFRIFIISFFVIGLLIILSILADEAVKYQNPDTVLLRIIAKTYWIFSFPINILFWILDYNISPTFILIGFTSNSLLVSLLIERIFYLRKKKKSKSQPVQTPGSS
jgi:hypothetical protein